MHDVSFYLFTLVFNALFSYLIAKFIGSKREIGLGWSFFMSFMLGWFIGLIFTLVSKKEEPEFDVIDKKTTIIMKFFGWFSIIIGVAGLFIAPFTPGADIADIKNMFLGGVFWAVIGCYFVHLSQKREKKAKKRKEWEKQNEECKK